MKMKLAATVLASAASMACAQPASNDPQSVTTDYLLNTLVQIAVTEDLSDYKRIGGLLKIDFVMVQFEPRNTDEGEILVAAALSRSKSPGYLAPNGYLNYGVGSAPKRRSALSLTFNSPETCMKANDVYSAFVRHGSLNPRPAPSQVPPPPGTFYPPVKKDQPVYGYAFKGKQTSVLLTFAYTNCLTDIQFGQPAHN